MPVTARSLTSACRNECRVQCWHRSTQRLPGGFESLTPRVTVTCVLQRSSMYTCDLTRRLGETAAGEDSRSHEGRRGCDYPARDAEHRGVAGRLSSTGTPRRNVTTAPPGGWPEARLKPRRASLGSTWARSAFPRGGVAGCWTSSSEAPTGCQPPVEQRSPRRGTSHDAIRAPKRTSREASSATQLPAPRQHRGSRGHRGDRH